MLTNILVFNDFGITSIIFYFLLIVGFSISEIEKQESSQLTEHRSLINVLLSMIIMLKNCNMVYIGSAIIFM